MTFKTFCEDNKISNLSTSIDVFEPSRSFTNRQLFLLVKQAYDLGIDSRDAEVAGKDQVIKMLRDNQPAIRLEVKERGWLRQLLGF